MFYLNTKDALDKFDARSNEDIFVGYSTQSKTYRIFNKKIFTIEESLHIKFDEYLTKHISNTSSHDDDDIINTPIELPKVYAEVRDHPHDLIIGDISQGVQTRSKLN